jgi:magnesium-transporting ATPase (P-type)
LQDGVPEAIDLLLHAKIVIVVLTGDKQETAVAIGKAANIIQGNAQLHFINSTVPAEVGQALESLKNLIDGAKGNPHALVIHGDSLEIAIKQHKVPFLHVLPLLQTVVCSRATPSQKAGMVSLVRTELKKVCLAIGDGANDVSMIQKADVGVGLTGKEGTQAQSSDFILHRFRHLPRLLFVHGRFAYMRMCKVVYWSFYKNTMFPFPLFFYGIFSSWTNQPFYDSFVMNLFNVVFTSWPPLVIGWTEKDRSDDFLIGNPRTYTWHRDTQKFSVRTFAYWILFAIVQAAILFWIAFGIFYDVDVISSDGRVSGIYVFGQWIATACMIVVNITFLTESMNWTRAIIGATLFGPSIYLLSYIAFNNWVDYFPDLFGISPYLFGSGSSYLYQIICVVFCLIPVHLRNQRRSRQKIELD